MGAYMRLIVFKTDKLLFLPVPMSSNKCEEIMEQDKYFDFY